MQEKQNNYIDPTIEEVKDIEQKQNIISKFSNKQLVNDLSQMLVGSDEVKSKLVKKNTIYKRTKIANFGLKLNKLYSNISTWKLILITISTAIFFGVISVFLVKNVGIYNFGLAAFGQAFSRFLVVLFKEDQISVQLRNLIDQFVFWIAYIILSIPIFVFGYKKIGKMFSNLTVLFLVVSSVVAFSIGLIPGVNNIYLIGDFSNSLVKTSLEDYYKPLSSIIPLSWSDGGNIIALFLFAIIYGYLLAWIFAIIQIIGGTAGVTGIIGEWYANTKQKSFGSISGYMNIVIVLIGVLVGSWLPGSILLQKAFGEQAKNNALTEEQIKIYKLAWSFELYLSPNFIATILTNIVYIIVLNKLYPKFKLVRVEIYSMKHSQEIAIKLRDDKKIVTGITLFNGRGGFSYEYIEIVTSITLFRQVNRLIKDVRKIDQDAFISISDVTSIDGYIYLPQDKF
ncbi:DUF2179 domain-containing protein [Mycoplasmopsis felis]|uniref:DUF2179 domain-containing protein n=1 Tax=Mycoplasmopsis felis TaxID=33923 RepID=UPI002AFE06D0|nr:DUF2179 domain-containing protein [Mycoplasmopsis felis]WQQ06293.1 DUF2179 domain-containing protein [Mycoplasmopsis felis]